MKLLAYLFRIYLKSSIHIALAVSSLLYISMNSHQIEYQKALYELVFFGSIVAYNFIKYGLEVKKYVISSKRVMIPLLLISVISIGISVVALFELTYNQIFLVLLMGFLIYLYTIPFIPSLPNFRNLSRIKIYIVALVWAGITTLLPLIDHSTDFLIIEFVQRFILVLILMIPFEIRDLKYDANSLNTLAQTLGVNGVKKFGYLLVLLWLLSSLYLGLKPIALVIFIALLLILALALSNSERKRVYTEFWVESIPIAYAFIDALLSNY